MRLDLVRDHQLAAGGVRDRHAVLAPLVRDRVGRVDGEHDVARADAPHGLGIRLEDDLRPVAERRGARRERADEHVDVLHGVLGRVPFLEGPVEVAPGRGVRVVSDAEAGRARPRVVAVAAERDERQDRLALQVVVDLHRAVAAGGRGGADAVAEVEDRPAGAGDVLGVPLAVVVRPELDVAFGPVARVDGDDAVVRARVHGEVRDVALVADLALHARHAELRGVLAVGVHRGARPVPVVRLLQLHAVRHAVEAHAAVEAALVHEVVRARIGVAHGVRDLQLVEQLVVGELGDGVREERRDRRVARDHGKRGVGGVRRERDDERVRGVHAERLREGEHHVARLAGGGRHVHDPDGRIGEGVAVRRLQDLLHGDRE